VRSWIGVIALILAVIMNESAIDSMQSGLTASFTSHFFKDQHVIFSRMIVMVINIPLMIIALQVSQPCMGIHRLSTLWKASDT
jgi:hypothetical protein